MVKAEFSGDMKGEAWELDATVDALIAEVGNIPV